MKKRMRIASLVLFGLALAGCVPSWNSFYKAKDLVFDQQLVGDWRPVQANENSRESWAFTKSGDKLYRLQQTDEEGRKAVFETALFKFNNQLFIDLYLTKLEGEGLKVNAWAAVALVPAHLLFRVEQLTPSLKLAAMNPDWIRNHLKQHPDSIAHRVVSNGDIILSANTSDLQEFLLSHMGDKEFFGDAMEMKTK